MNDFTTDAAAPVSLPDSQPSAPPASAEDAIETNRNRALGQLAKKEDISDFAAERQDQAAVMDRGEEIPEDRKSQWYRRASKALSDATNEALGIKSNGWTGPPENPGYVESSEGVDPQQLDPVGYARKEGAAAQRVAAYFGDNQGAKQNIVDWGQAMDPESHVAEWLVDNESSVAPQILERLAANPEGWQQLASLPPQTRDRWLSKLEGHIEAELRFGQQQAQRQQELAQLAERRTSKAPPIIKAPRGGANPPRDAHQLAQRDDVSSYVNLRRQQERKDRDWHR
jgi:hypothetical protein